MMIPENTTFKKTRIAPTPSGYLHLGNVLSFIITVELAKRADAQILLRIDDLDRQRANPLYIQDIFDTLNFMEIGWDEGPRSINEVETEWSQVHRMELYSDAIKQLTESGYLFACTCSRTRLRAAETPDVQPCDCPQKNLPFYTKDSCLRIKTNMGSTLPIKTLTGGTITAALPAEMNDFIVRKKDGYPAYQLTSVLDDLHFEIDMVVRGKDLWPSTLAQIYLANLLGKSGFSAITFHHHPLLMASEDKKLSKSAGDTSIKYLREHGKKRKDIYQLIGAMCGIQEPVSDSKSLFGQVFKG